MKSDLSCEVVRDLLPSYIDGLTSEETSRLIRAHLDGCEACRGIHREMTNEEPPKAEQPEVDYLKKVRASGKRLRRMVIIAGCAVLAQYAAGPERPAFLHVKFGVRSGQHICLPEKGAVELDELIDFFLQRHVIKQFSEFPVFHCAVLPLYTGAFDALIIHARGQRGKKQIAEHRTGNTGKAGPKAGREAGSR